MCEKIVNWVENLCDSFETLDPKMLDDDWHYNPGWEVSIIATVPAIRVHYYANGHNRMDDIYKRIEYCLHSLPNWNDMELEEKKGLLEHVGMNTILVHKSSFVQETY